MTPHCQNTCLHHYLYNADGALWRVRIRSITVQFAEVTLPYMTADRNAHSHDGYFAKFRYSAFNEYRDCATRNRC